MKTKTTTLNTTQATPAALIQSDDQLTHCVATLASLTLMLNQCASNQAAQIEAMTAAHAEATQSSRAESLILLARIEAYATANRERLARSAKGKAAQSFSVLGHSLNWRTSSTVSTESDSVRCIRAAIEQTATVLDQPELSESERNELLMRHMSLCDLLRTGSTTIDKERVKALKSGIETERAVLALITREAGVSINDTETFAIAFKFNPQA
jgi:phage host-nuclease inhibitor protein Gam